jgi:hypothetical protein
MNAAVKILHVGLLILVILTLIALIYLQLKNRAIVCYEISLETSCFIGVGIGLFLNLRCGIRGLYYGLSLLSAITGGIVGLQKISLHICPNAPAFGDPIFGFSVCAWSLIAFGFFIFAVGVLLIVPQNRQSIN